MDILFIISMNVSMLIKWLYSGAPKRVDHRILKVQHVFEHVIHFLLNTCLSWCQFLDPYLTTQLSNIGAQLLCSIQVCVYLDMNWSYVEVDDDII